MSAPAQPIPVEPIPAQPGLEAGAIGLVDALVIGLAATSPAYSLPP